MAGASASGWRLFEPSAPVFVWLSDERASSGLAVFGAFGAMSGFALAAMSLIAASATTDTLRALVDSNPGRHALRILLGSAWAWFAASIAGLTLLVVDSPWADVLLLVAMGAAAGQGTAALVAFHLFFARFVVQRPD